jgi:hypothetical protein
MLIFLYLKDLWNLFFRHCIEQLKKFLMHVSTLQCGHLLWLDRYLTIFKLLPRVYQHVTCYKLNCFNDTLSQISQTSNFSAVHYVLNKPPCKKVKWCLIRRSRGPGSRTSSSGPTSRKCLIQKRGNISVDWGGAPSCWNMKCLCTAEKLEIWLIWDNVSLKQLSL